MIGVGTVRTPRSWMKFADVEGVVPEGKTPLNWPLSGLPTASVTADITPIP